MRKTIYSAHKWRPFFLLGSVGLPVALRCHRQGDAIACPTSGNVISTDRPDFTSPPTVVTTGSVQFENGVTWSTEQRSNVVDGPETLVRLGGRSLYGDFFSACLTISTHRRHRAGRLFGFRRLGQARIPRRLIGFRIAAIAGLSFATGGSQISSHGYDPVLQLPWKHPIGEHWAVEGMFAITWLTTEPHDNPTFESTFEIERKIGTWANVFVEYAANYPRHARPTDLFDGAALWRVTSRQQLDLHAGFGINRPTPDHFFGLGYSFRLDGLF